MSAATTAGALTRAGTETMYFIGVSTGSSAVHSVFAAWKPMLGIPDASLIGIDLPLDASDEDYRSVARFIIGDPLSRGALVTTHKLNLFRACADLFTSLDASARLLHEVSCLAVRDGGLLGFALDTTSSRLALEAVTDVGGRDVLLMGAGGAALALATHLSCLDGAAAARRVIVTDIRQSNLDELARVVSLSASSTAWDYRIVDPDGVQDEVLSELAGGALIVNATGKGKDRPGSPLSDDVVFPLDAVVWEFNYRGSLEFLRQAEAQQQERGLDVHDGWIYFVHGWTRAIAEVFEIHIPSNGPDFDALAAAAKAAR